MGRRQKNGKPLHRDRKQKRICVTEVTSVEAFDEETILTNLREEGLIISGKNLHIEALDLEEGKLVAEGEIESLSYTKKKNGKGIFDRFSRFKR